MSNKSIADLIAIISEFDWVVALPKDNENNEVAGMIIGTQEYVDDILNKINNTEIAFESVNSE